MTPARTGGRGGLSAPCAVPDDEATSCIWAGKHVWHR